MSLPHYQITTSGGSSPTYTTTLVSTGAQAYKGTSIASAINAAVTALTGGGTVEFMGGTFTASTPTAITPLANTLIEGQGSTTILSGLGFMLQYANQTIQNLSFTGTLASWFGCVNIVSVSGSSASNVTLTNLTANTIRAATGVYVIAPIDGTTIDTIHMSNCVTNNSDGFGFLVTGSGTVNGATVQNVWMDSCVSTYAGVASTRSNIWATGFDLDEFPTVKNFYITNCTATYSWESGFHLEPAPTHVNINIANCTSSYNGQKPSTFNNGSGPNGVIFGYGFFVDAGVTLINPTGTGNTGSNINVKIGRAHV